MIRTSVQLPPVHPFTGMDVASALAQRVSRFGDDPFLIWESTPGEPLRWTYGEFADEVDLVAAGLVERGVRAGDAVMLLLENSPAFVFCWFACARLGAVAVDTNARYAADELAHTLSLTSAVGVVTHRHLLARLEASGMMPAWTVTLDEPTWTCRALHGDPKRIPTRVADPGAPLCVQLTSGTTSRPKAVLYTHANALWGAKVGAAHSGTTRDDVTLVYGPLFHTQALSWMFLATFWTGGTVVLLPKFTASRFWDIALRHRCTQTNVLGILLKTAGAQEVPDHSFRRWIFAMERPEIEARFGIRLFNAWGMTEVVTEVIVSDLDHPAEPGAIGRLAPEYHARIVREDDTDCGVGEPGELLVGGVRGLSLFAEYVDDNAATSAAFDDAGYFRTGDQVVMLPTGAIRFESRTKDMLKVGGENVAAAEIERVLLEVPGVTAAAVVARPDPMRDEVPVGFVTIDPGADSRSIPEQAISACAERLADFKVPRDIYVVDALPEALLGKIAKATLRTWALERAASA
jgi:crotonobetaine/carnitine-CoA ligase